MEQRDLTRSHQAAKLWNAMWAVVGIAAFAAPQVALFVTTPPSPIMEDPGWFLNGGRNVATIGVVIGVVATLLAVRRRWRIEETATFGLGVLIAMAVTLFTIGPGTIFPIVIAVGAVVVGLVIAMGTAVGYAIQRAAIRTQPQ